MCNQGTGLVHPEDTEEFIEVTVKVCDDIVTEAFYRCSPSETLEDCGETVCRVIKGHNLPDIMQTTNNAVFYNTRQPIPGSLLYMGAMAIMAAKKACMDYSRKNGTELKGGCCGCL